MKLPVFDNTGHPMQGSLVGCGRLAIGRSFSIST
jgi:hypothetical protein